MSAPNVDVVNHSAPSAHDVAPHGAEAASVVTQLPESKLSRTEFGLKAGNFEYNSTLKSEYQESAQYVAAQIREYQGKGGELTDGQKKFLQLYDKNATGLLDTTEGWIATHLALEQQMFIEGAIVDEDLQLLIKEKGKQPEHGEVTVPKEVFEQGFLNKYGRKALAVAGIAGTAPLSLPLIGAIKAWNSAVKHSSREITFNLGHQHVDTSRLSEPERKYMEYLKKGANKADIGNFLLHAGESQYKFYKQLGIDVSKLEGPTSSQSSLTRGEKFMAFLGADISGREGVASSWGRLDRGTSLGNTELNRLGTSWERYRLDQIQKIVDEEFAGAFPSAATDGAHRAELYSRAQQRTLEHFASLALAKTVEKGAAPPTETLSSITVMEARATKLKDPAEMQALRTKKEAELKSSESALTPLSTSIEKTSGEIETLTKTINRETLNTAGNLARIGTIKTAEIPALEGQISYLEGQRTADEATLKAQILAMPGDKQAAAELQKVAALQKYTDQIKKVEAQIATLRSEADTLEANLIKINADIAERSFLQTKLDTSKTDKKKLESMIKRLKKQIEQPLAVDAREKIDELDTTVKSLKRHSDVISGVLRNEDGLTPQLLSEDTLVPPKHSRFASVFEEGKEIGYLATLDHLFKYSKDADPKHAFETAQRILPPDMLMEIIREHFKMPRIPGPLRAGDSGLPEALQELRQKGVTSSQMSDLFMNIMEHVEQRGLRTS